MLRTEQPTCDGETDYIKVKTVISNIFMHRFTESKRTGIVQKYEYMV